MGHNEASIRLVDVLKTQGTQVFFIGAHARVQQTVVPKNVGNGKFHNGPVIDTKKKLNLLLLNVPTSDLLGKLKYINLFTLIRYHFPALNTYEQYLSIVYTGALIMPSAPGLTQSTIAQPCLTHTDQAAC